MNISPIKQNFFNARCLNYKITKPHVYNNKQLLPRENSDNFGLYLQNIKQITFSAGISEPCETYSNDNKYEYMIETSKNSSKEPHYRDGFIGKILEAISESPNTRGKWLKPLLDAKNPNGTIRIPNMAIYFILKVLTPENEKYLQTLLDKKDENGNYRLDGLDISYILPALTPENEKYLQTLLDKKDENGNYKFNGLGASFFLDQIKNAPQSAKYLSFLMDECRNSTDSVILPYLNDSNLNCFRILSQPRNNLGFIYDAGNIAEILEILDDENRKYLEDLVNKKDADGKYTYRCPSLIDALIKISSSSKR